MIRKYFFFQIEFLFQYKNFFKCDEIQVTPLIHKVLLNKISADQYSNVKKKFQLHIELHKTLLFFELIMKLQSVNKGRFRVNFVNIYLSYSIILEIIIK